MSRKYSSTCMGWENPWLAVVMQYLPSIQYSSGAGPLGSQWMRTSPPLVLSVWIVEAYTPFRNWIALDNTWDGTGENNPLNTCSANLFMVCSSCSTNRWFKIDPAKGMCFYCPLLRAFLFLTCMSAFESETSHFIREVCVLLLHAQCVWAELQTPGAGVMPSGKREVELKKDSWVWGRLVQFLF